MKCLPIVLLILSGLCTRIQSLHFDPTPSDLSINVDKCINLTLRQSENITQFTDVTIWSEYPEVATATPTSFHENSTWSRPIEICGTGGGRSTIIAEETAGNETLVAYLPVTVSKGRILQVMSDVSGWTYFFAWSISCYPQPFLNYSRKSVVGLDFNHITLNIVGHLTYAAYNVGMYFVYEIKREYFSRHPRGMNPVMLNDVIFSVEAFLATLFVTYQCYIYESGSQKVSWIVKYIIYLYLIILSTLSIFAYMNMMHWLDFLLCCSYIKLSVSMIKYIPQALLNYSRKSTLGWNIEQVILGLIGGVFSILQMIINSYNYDDWDSIIGDPTKFGLGLLSIFFDFFFMYQHYVLYRNPYFEIIPEKKRLDDRPLISIM